MHTHTTMNAWGGGGGVSQGHFNMWTEGAGDQSTENKVLFDRSSTQCSITCPVLAFLFIFKHKNKKKTLSYLQPCTCSAQANNYERIMHLK